MILFAGFDPGSKNHLRPVLDRAVEMAEPAQLVDLAQSTDLMTESSANGLLRDLKPDILVAGTSGNQGEKALLEACRSLRIPTVAIVDIAAAGKFDSDPDSAADLFLVSSEGCRSELVEMGVGPDKIVLAGSTHLEQLAQTTLRDESPMISEYFGASPTQVLCPLFCRPNPVESVGALESLANAITELELESLLIVTRSHPRDRDRHRIEQFCKEHENFVYDLQDDVSTLDLLAHVPLSLSLASTTSLESIVAGAPSAFYLMGWDCSAMEIMFKNIPAVPTVRSSIDLREFLDTALAERAAGDAILNPKDLENYHGALDRSWSAIMGLSGRHSRLGHK